MSEDPKILEQGVESPVRLFSKSVGQLQLNGPSPQRPRPMAVNNKSVNLTPAFGSYKPVNIHSSNQVITRDGRNKELRLAQLDIKDRLNKVDSGLRVLKARLKIKEEQLRSRRDMSKSIMNVEQEMKVKIEKVKEELNAKEKQAAARRTKKNDVRDEWAKKQKADSEHREAKQQEQAKTDRGVEMASAGVTTAAPCEDDFDIDVYGD
ncbi:hypothetical protein G6011_07186 [Alternaria panax]|uniref:Uncharacterized protein n=1 Tax=Alternaria panax TaxID=48097 RepID=A0AAD4FAG4_9PLEO|nr:hypothetical protein G6011_07186 [Alternaria panax]